jgi:hypothetical protein
MKKFFTKSLLIIIILMISGLWITKIFFLDKTKLSEPLSDIREVSTCDCEIYKNYVFVKNLNSNYLSEDTIDK